MSVTFKRGFGAVKFGRGFGAVNRDEAAAGVDTVDTSDPVYPAGVYDDSSLGTQNLADGMVDDGDLPFPPWDEGSTASMADGSPSVFGGDSDPGNVSVIGDTLPGTGSEEPPATDGPLPGQPGYSSDVIGDKLGKPSTSTPSSGGGGSTTKPLAEIDVGLSTGAKIAIGLGVGAIAAFGVYKLTKKKRAA